MKDYYTVLDLEPSSTQEQIKKAYRYLATKYHPDKHDGDEFFKNKFIEVQEAYNTLSNTEHRRTYDEAYHEFHHPQTPKQPDKQPVTHREDLYADADQYIYWTQQWFNKGNWQKALEENEKAIKLFPKYGFLYHIKADIYRSIKQPNIALKHYKEAVAYGSADSKNDVIELETLKTNSEASYFKVIYQSGFFHLILAVILIIRPKTMDTFGYSLSAVFITSIIWFIYLAYQSRQMPAEAKLMMDSSPKVSISILIGGALFIVLPFIIN